MLKILRDKLGEDPRTTSVLLAFLAEMWDISEPLI